jgi:hypothetical protein
MRIKNSSVTTGIVGAAIYIGLVALAQTGLIGFVAATVILLTAAGYLGVD